MEVGGDGGDAKISLIAIEKTKDGPNETKDQDSIMGEMEQKMLNRKTINQ